MLINYTSRILRVCLFLFWGSLLQGQDNVLSQRIQALHASGTVFEPVSQLFKALPALKKPQNDLQRGAQRLQLQPDQLQNIISYRPEAITLQLPYLTGSITVELFQVNILSNQFKVKNGTGEDQTYTPGVYYRGVIGGNNQSLAAISFFENEVIGVISSPETGNLNLGRVELQNTQNEYALFSDALLPAMPFNDCATREGDHQMSPPTSSPDMVAGCVTIFFEADYALYQNKGSVQNTVNYVTGFFNAVAAIYTNETISIAISQIFVWTTPDAYPTSSSSDGLDAFMALRSSFTGDLAHLVSLSGSGLGGVAYLSVLCSSTNNYAYSGINSSYQSYPTYSWTVNVVSHEMGHNFGSRHTHWCGWTGGAIDNCGPTAGYGFETPPSCSSGPTPAAGGGTIMSYCHLVGGVGITLSNGFGTQPGNTIRTATTSALGSSCITSACPTYACAEPTNLSISGVTSTAATVNWSAAAGATSYTLQYRQTIGFGSWTTITGITGTSRTITGLSGATEYEVQVKTVCASGDSKYATGVIFLTSTSACTEPNTLTATPLSSTQTSLDWTQTGGSITSWDIQYGATGFTLGGGTTVNTTSHPYTLSGLVAGSTYDYYVRSNCSGGLGSSTWVGPLTFTSPFANDISSGAILLTVNGACSGNIYTNVGYTTSPNEFNPYFPNGGDWFSDYSHTAWFKFVAPASGSVKINTDFSPQGTLTDTQVALYSTSTPTNLSQLLASNEDGGSVGLGYNTRLYYSGLTAGTTYYIQVDGWGTDVGTFCIEVREQFELPTSSTCTTYTEDNVDGSAAPGKWFNLYTRTLGGDIGVPVAAVKSSVNLGTVTTNLIVNSSVPTAPSGVKYMQRYYNFTSSTNNSASKEIRLFYTNTEFNAFKTATGLSALTTDDLNISHYDGTNEDCTPNNNDANTYTVLTGAAVTPTAIGSSGYFYLQFTSPSFSEMGALFNNSIVPIELLSFQGIAKDNGNLITWNTASEKDLDFFELEQSESGLMGWKTCTQQRSVPSVDGIRNYSYLDRSPATRSFYRLAIHNLDGSVEYTDIVRVDRGKQGGLRSIVPNPASEMIQIDYTALQEETVQFKIYGGDGQLVLNQSIDLAEGQNLLPFDISALPAGVYFCMANGEQGLQFIKK